MCTKLKNGHEDLSAKKAWAPHVFDRLPMGLVRRVDGHHGVAARFCCCPPPQKPGLGCSALALVAPQGAPALWTRNPEALPWTWSGSQEMKAERTVSAPCARTVLWLGDFTRKGQTWRAAVEDGRERGSNKSRVGRVEAKEVGLSMACSLENMAERQNGPAIR